METVANFIHGECVTGSGQRVQAIFNPATGEQIPPGGDEYDTGNRAGHCGSARRIPRVGAPFSVKTCASDVPL